MTKQRLIEESKINKLIADYENQIIGYDKQLKIIKNQEHELRKSQDDHVEWKIEDLFKDRQVVNAQKQRTVQFISDLKYL